MSSTPTVGQVYELGLVEDLSRTQIVQYAGASGDFNPLHTDEVYAREAAGFPGVFAHGMLTMGMTGRVLTDHFGIGAVRSFGGRFLAQVWPGDTLVAQAEVVDVEGTEVTLEVSTTNQHGDRVFSGQARVEVSD